MEITYDHDACDTCPLAACAFDDDTLTVGQQDARCPAVVSQPDDQKANYHQWRADKLELIRQSLAERGAPIPLSELPALAEVPMGLIRSWRFYFMEAELVRSPNQRGSLAYITSVATVKIERNGGHEKAARQKRLGALRQILAERGPLSVAEISERMGIHTSVLHYWVGRYVIGKKVRVDHWDGRNKKIMLIEEVM